MCMLFHKPHVLFKEICEQAVVDNIDIWPCWQGRKNSAMETEAVVCCRSRLLLGHAGKVGKLCSAMETDSVQKFDMAVLGLR